MPGDVVARRRAALDVLRSSTETILDPLLGLDADGASRPAGSQFSEDVGGGVGVDAGGAGPPRLPRQSAGRRAGRRDGERRRVMPQKATYFYPKLATGMVLNRLD